MNVDFQKALLSFLEAGFISSMNKPFLKVSQVQPQTNPLVIPLYKLLQALFSAVGKLTSPMEQKMTPEEKRNLQQEKPSPTIQNLLTSERVNVAQKTPLIEHPEKTLPPTTFFLQSPEKTVSFFRSNAFLANPKSPLILETFILTISKEIQARFPEIKNYLSILNRNLQSLQSLLPSSQKSEVQTVLNKVVQDLFYPSSIKNERVENYSLPSSPLPASKESVVDQILSLILPQAAPPTLSQNNNQLPLGFVAPYTHPSKSEARNGTKRKKKSAREKVLEELEEEEENSYFSNSDANSKKY